MKDREIAADIEALVKDIGKEAFLSHLYAYKTYEEINRTGVRLGQWFVNLVGEGDKLGSLYYEEDSALVRSLLEDKAHYIFEEGHYSE